MTLSQWKTIPNKKVKLVFSTQEVAKGDLEQIHSSRTEQETLLKIPTKWHPRSTVVKLTSPKDRNCEVCKTTKITRAPGEKREKFDDSTTAEHVFSMKMVNPETIADTLSWYKI